MRAAPPWALPIPQPLGLGHVETGEHFQKLRAGPGLYLCMQLTVSSLTMTRDNEVTLRGGPGSDSRFDPEQATVGVSRLYGVQGSHLPPWTGPPGLTSSCRLKSPGDLSVQFCGAQCAHTVQPPPPAFSGTFPSCTTETPSLLNTDSPSPLPQLLATRVLRSVYFLSLRIGRL